MNINTYATLDAMLNRFGRDDLVDVTDTEAPYTGEYDRVKLQSAIDAANAEVDAYLAKVLNVPTVVASAFVQMMACDIARYHVALGNSRVTDRDEKRYDTAVKNLKEMNKGNIGTGASTADTTAAGSNNVAMMTSGRPTAFGKLNF